MTNENEKPKVDKVALVSYLASLIAIVNYLDDTGLEYHQQRLIIAQEFVTTLNLVNDALVEASPEVTKGLKDNKPNTEPTEQA